MLYETTITSIIIQALTGLIEIWGLTNIRVNEQNNIYRDLLKVELFVQSIEFFFYIWLISNFSNITNITPFRYADWFITTPIMLITLMAYLYSKNTTGLIDFISKNFNPVLFVVVLNVFMLVLGFLGEIGKINIITSSILGFLPFVYYFYYIYNNYLPKENDVTREEKDNKNKIYWYFVIFWSLYGVASFLEHDTKNIMFNILDLFAKNFFGIFLVYLLWMRRIPTRTI